MYSVGICAQNSNKCIRDFMRLASRIDVTKLSLYSKHNVSSVDISPRQHFCYHFSHCYAACLKLYMFWHVCTLSVAKT